MISNNVIAFKKQQLDRNKTVAILGTSSSSEKVVEERGTAYSVAYELAKLGFNIITGGGFGIMSSANAGAKAADPTKSFHADVVTWIDKHPEKLSQRVSLKTNPNRRTEYFENVAKYWVVFPGGPGTASELLSAVSKNFYNPKDENSKNVIICVGRKFFNPLIQFFRNMDNKDLAKNVEKVIHSVDTKDEIIDIILNNDSKLASAVSK